MQLDYVIQLTTIASFPLEQIDEEAKVRKMLRFEIKANMEPTCNNYDIWLLYAHQFQQGQFL